MRALLLTVALTLSLAACGPKSETASPPPAETPATETSPAPETAPPPPTAEAPSAGDQPAESAPAPQDQPSLAPPQESSAAPQPKAVTRSLIRATPVIVEIDRTQERRPANGGSSVVLFSDGAANANRNLVTCVNVWNLMDTATTQEIRVGIRKADDGTVEALRPLYWLNRTATPPAERDCSERLANYDFVRAKTIRDKYRLTNAGPYFVVARSDEQAAAIIDLTGRSDREIADMVHYFRDGFAFQNDIWDPARSEPAQKRALLSAFFGSRFRESLVASLGFIANPAARAGCRLGDLKDAPCT